MSNDLMAGTSSVNFKLLGNASVPCEESSVSLVSDPLTGVDALPWVRLGAQRPRGDFDVRQYIRCAEWRMWRFKYRHSCHYRGVHHYLCLSNCDLLLALLSQFGFT